MKDAPIQFSRAMTVKTNERPSEFIQAAFPRVG